MRIGLVLGAGAYPGHAWHVGVLHGLEDAWGWDAREAELVVGTSIGAISGATIRGGFPVRDLAASIVDAAMTPVGHDLASNHIDPPFALPPDLGPLQWPRSLIPNGLGALRALAGLDDERHVRSLLLTALGGLLPKGHSDLWPVGHSIDILHGGHWPDREFWAVATRVSDGRREVFGRAGAPLTTPGLACTASGSIPGVFRPVTIGDERYCDAGIGSSTHAELLLEHAHLDLVVVSAPLASAGPVSLSVDAPVRAVVSAQLRHEVHVLERAGHRVLLVAPSSAAARAMGTNPLLDDRMAQRQVYGLARVEAREAGAGIKP